MTEVNGGADEAEKAARAGSFGAAADVYERGRPPYPDEAVDWLLAGGGRRVVDLGAGTGKLTRRLVARDLDVTAVEPSAGMREQLATAVPGARILAGSAEEVPLPDAAADTVLMAQAWHWVDPRRAVPEVARVLVPGGTLGLVWNIRDTRDEWTARLDRLLGRRGAPSFGELAPSGLTDRPDLFAPAEEFTVEWRYRLGTRQLTDLVASRSNVISMPAGRREALLAEVAELAGSHPVLGGTGEVELPYVTTCYRAARRGSAG